MNKKVYLLKGDSDCYEFADFFPNGTYLHENICKECLMPIIGKPYFVEPYQIEWQVGSDLIGDFSWVRCDYNILIREKVKNFLQERVFECGFGKTEIVPPERKRKKVRRVEYPYEGENLYLLLAKKSLNLDIKKTGLKVKLDCKVCGNLMHTFQRDGIVIPKNEWSGEKIFNITQFGSVITYVTEDGLQEILSQNFSNFGYREVGVIE